jgi:hypothetical protein
MFSTFTNTFPNKLHIGGSTLAEASVSEDGKLNLVFHLEVSTSDEPAILKIDDLEVNPFLLEIDCNQLYTLSSVRTVSLNISKTLVDDQLVFELTMPEPVEIISAKEIEESHRKLFGKKLKIIRD